MVAAILRNLKLRTSEEFCRARDGAGRGNPMGFGSLCRRGKQREQRRGEREDKMAHQIQLSRSIGVYRESGPRA